MLSAQIRKAKRFVVIISWVCVKLLVYSVKKLTTRQLIRMMVHIHRKLLFRRACISMKVQVITCRIFSKVLADYPWRIIMVKHQRLPDWWRCWNFWFCFTARFPTRRYGNAFRMKLNAAGTSWSLHTLPIPHGHDRCGQCNGFSTNSQRFKIPALLSVFIPTLSLFPSSTALGYQPLITSFSCCNFSDLSRNIDTDR